MASVAALWVLMFISAVAVEPKSNRIECVSNEVGCRVDLLEHEQRNKLADLKLAVPRVLREVEMRLHPYASHAATLVRIERAEGEWVNGGVGYCFYAELLIGESVCGRDRGSGKHCDVERIGGKRERHAVGIYSFPPTLSTGITFGDSIDTVGCGAGQ